MGGSGEASWSRLALSILVEEVSVGCIVMKEEVCECSSLSRAACKLVVSREPTTHGQRVGAQAWSAEC